MTGPLEPRPPLPQARAEGPPAAGPVPQGATDAASRRSLPQAANEVPVADTTAAGPTAASRPADERRRIPQAARER